MAGAAAAIPRKIAAAETALENMLNLRPHFPGLGFVGVHRVSEPPQDAEHRDDQKSQDDEPFSHLSFAFRLNSQGSKIAGTVSSV